MGKSKKAALSSQPEVPVSIKPVSSISAPNQLTARKTRSMEAQSEPGLAPSPPSSFASPASDSFAKIVRSSDDNLDLSKSPVQRTENVKLTMDHISGEVDYWAPSVVCHVLGGNPPLTVFQQFVNRIWESVEVDRVAVLAKGFFIVRFCNMDARIKAIEGGMPSFDKKPVVLTPWTPDFDVSLVDEKIVPIWVRLPNLPLKYWGREALTLICSQLGKPMRLDNATAKRERLHFARILVEVDITKQFPTEISFENEKDDLVSYKVEFEWKPIKCVKCNMFGHLADVCKLEERMQLQCEYCNLKGHTKAQCKRKGKQPAKSSGKSDDGSKKVGTAAGAPGGEDAWLTVTKKGLKIADSDPPVTSEPVQIGPQEERASTEMQGFSEEGKMDEGGGLISVPHG